MFPSKRKGSPSPSHAPAPKRPKRASPWDPPFTGELSPIRRDYHLPCPSTSPDFVVQLNSLKESLMTTLQEVFVTFLLMWAHLKIQITFEKEGEACSFWFILPKHYIKQEQDLEDIIEKMLEDLVHFFMEELGNEKSYSNTGRNLELRIPLSSSHATALKTK
ncbi:unnamed protein product [Cyprideis torosa]|uniref:Uncharacterized protein n=1 Tax=Cyprideis torosa TaxID=163714 RepID=A0A7R8ZW28_9CRUS|nr:unnamed protein product [Cyprideis torosa]CAG0904066.1 unnamed protein product [Cyprideis torosa]